ncbi:MAG: AI-2E family transporter [Caldithrix sp.]|nr:AI-2E family transporter [Caldithrix sp.]
MDPIIRKFIKFVIAGLVLLAIGWLLVTIHSTLTILIIATLIAYILNPVVLYLEVKGFSRLQATIIIFTAITLLIAITGYFLVPPLIKEIMQFQKGVSSGTAGIYLQQLNNFIDQSIPMLNSESLDLQGKISQWLQQLSNSLFFIIGSIVSVVTTLVILPFASFFLLKDGRQLKRSLVSLIPNRYFEMTLNIIYKIDIQLGGYLRGQFIDAVIIGFLAVNALWVLDVHYNVLIGIFAGLTNMIPYVGPIVGATTAIIVELVHGGGGQEILLVAIAFAIIQLLDNVLIQPLVVAKSVNLHPLIIIFAVIIGGQFFGILGMVLAVPAAGMLKVLISEFYTGVRKYKVV